MKDSEPHVGHASVAFGGVILIMVAIRVQNDEAVTEAIAACFRAAIEEDHEILELVNIGMEQMASPKITLGIDAAEFSTALPLFSLDPCDRRAACTRLKTILQFVAVFLRFCKTTGSEAVILC
jgi:hypothetical protein